MGRRRGSRGAIARSGSSGTKLVVEEAVGGAGCVAEGEHGVGEIHERAIQVLVVAVASAVAGTSTALNGFAEVVEGLGEGGEEAEVKGALYREGGGEVFDLGWTGAGGAGAGAGAGHCGLSGSL